MLAIAGEVGYSETAFLRPRPAADAGRAYDVKYFSAEAEVPFCGHATVAAAVALADREGPGDVMFTIGSGDVPVRTHRESDGSVLATLTSVAPAVHDILAAATRARPADLDYDYEGLKAYMIERDLTTVDLVWRADPLTFYARNPFPVGGVVEDPATGAAAAAFGAYLRAVGAVEPPAQVRILQGHDMGRPSRLLVDIDSERPEIQVTGTAVPIPSAN